MAIIFLTSSPTGPLDGSRKVDGLDPMNDFPKRLASYWKAGSRNLMISANPSNYPANEEMIRFFAGATARSGLTSSCFDVMDDRNYQMSKEEVQSYDVIWLGGGHVPTQNAFLQKADLRRKLQGFSGIIIGISAGSMNAAEWVYSVPEENGEAIDPAYHRWINGLGLTWRRILPHYQMVKDNILDGLRLYQDIILPDSIGTEFINLPDGSYILRDEKGRETLYGEAWMAKDGILSPIERLP